MPIRLRLTLGFAVAIALVLTATGLLVYARQAGDLRSAVDDGLYAHATSVAALVQSSDGGTVDGIGRVNSDQAGFAQILNHRGRIVQNTVGVDLRRVPLLTQSQLARVRHTAVFVDSRIGDDNVRVLARPATTSDGIHLVVVVGAFLDSSQVALSGLRRELLIGGSLALGLACLVGYALAAAALRPVERMRERAAAISATEPGQRLPLPARRDEITRLGQTLNEMLGRLEEGIEREREFVADASHELRTPLALLKTEIELALSHPSRPPAELQSALRSAGEETDRLIQLAEDLLLLAGIEKGRLSIRREPLQLDDLFATTALRFTRRGHDAGRRIITEPTPVILDADRVRLEQAIGNLVENALRYGAGTIRLFTLAHERHVELHVTDEGKGFPEDFIEHAFERFRRADEARSRGATGLGLAIVTAVAQAHGGDAHAANLAVGGADTWLSLPISPNHPDPTTAPALTAPATSTSPHH